MRGLRENELPTAMRNSINDLMRDVVKRERKEVERVFQKPTPLVKRAIVVKKRATKTDFEGIVWIDENFGEWGEALLNTLTPHIPGHPPTRRYKGMERALMHAGLIREGQYLIPSRTMRLDRHGNVPGHIAAKMLNDIHAFKYVSGFISETQKAKVKYSWGHARTKGGGLVTGIWLQNKFNRGQPGALQMMVVDATPTYAKRFKFYAVAKSWGRKRAAHHARIAVEHRIRRRS